jgi:ZIP family zinc transporter
MLGSAFVFMMKDEMSLRLQKSLLGFASGVMVAASVWSLLIPSMEMVEGKGAWSVLPAAIGFLLGMGFLLLVDELTPHLHIGTDQPEGMLESPLVGQPVVAEALTKAPSFFTS